MNHLKTNLVITHKNIHLLSTLYEFHNLQTLSCSNLKLRKLDLPQLPSLQTLYCDSNLLKNLDLSNLPNLQNLFCSYNQLKKLDLSQVPKLQNLHCLNNEITKLDLSNVPDLQDLICSHNQLKQLDLSKVPKLRDLDCSFNDLTRLNLSNVPKLRDVDCSFNQLTNLSLTHVPKLRELNCFGNRLTYLDIRRVPKLQELNCSENQILQLLSNDQQIARLRSFKNDNNPVTLQEMGRKNLSITLDKQNVHDSYISKQVINAYSNLKNYPPMKNVLNVINNDENIPVEVKQLINKYSQITDRHEALNLNYEEALSLVYPHHTSDSISAFNQEVINSVEHDADVCISGRLIKLINSLNGFIADVDIRVDLLQCINFQAGRIAEDNSIPEIDKLQAFLDAIDEEECIRQGIDLSHWKMQFTISPGE